MVITNARDGQLQTWLHPGALSLATSTVLASFFRSILYATRVRGEEASSSRTARHQRPISRTLLLFLSQSNPELCCTGLPWVTRSSLSLSCGQLDSEYTDCQGLRHKPGEEGESLGLSRGGVASRGPLGRGKVEQIKVSQVPLQTATLNPKVSSNGLGQRAGEGNLGKSSIAQSLGRSRKPRIIMWR